MTVDGDGVERAAGGTGGEGPSGERVSRSRAVRHGVQQARVALEEALARPAIPYPQQWGQRVVTALRELDEAFDRHVRHSEGPEGMLADIVQVAPRLAHSVGEIQREHKEILDAIGGLEVAAARLDDSADVPALREEALVLLRSIAAHRYRGADVISDAYNVDIEAAD